MKRSIVLMLALVLGIPAATAACTAIRIRPGDGSIVAARTLEFAVDLRSDLVVLPRGGSHVGTTTSGRPGLRWATKYGIVGMNAFGRPLLVDGLNEHGLAIGVLYFPGFARYQAIGRDEEVRSLAPTELATYLLGTCADVPEAVTAARAVRVGEVVLPEMGIVPPLHFIMHDRAGRCVVLEHVEGELKVHDNPLGVMTNAPTFDWHLTNLRNYVNLSVTSVPAVDLAGQKVAALGQGSGMLGLPGDFTPPSRFIRAVAYSQSALPVATAREGVLQAFHILNQFDIPKGAARESNRDKVVADYTLWTSAADLTNLRYYVHTYENRRIRMLDLGAAHLDGGELRTIRLKTEEMIEDLTAK
jgi:choloylglycine hydrolase